MICGAAAAADGSMDGAVLVAVAVMDGMVVPRRAASRRNRSSRVISALVISGSCGLAIPAAVFPVGRVIVCLNRRRRGWRRGHNRVCARRGAVESVRAVARGGGGDAGSGDHTCRSGSGDGQGHCSLHTLLTAEPERRFGRRRRIS
jgi:hypothetical protein